MVPVTGLWRQETKEGKVYYRGYMGQVKVLIFANEKKSSDSHPDFNIYFDVDNRKTNSKSNFKNNKGELEKNTKPTKTSWSAKQIDISNETSSKDVDVEF